jgi:hypothetical protein
MKKIKIRYIIQDMFNTNTEKMERVYFLQEKKYGLFWKTISYKDKVRDSNGKVHTSFSYEGLSKTEVLDKVIIGYYGFKSGSYYIINYPDIYVSELIIGTIKL